MDVTDVGRFEREGFLTLHHNFFSPSLTTSAAVAAKEAANAPAKHRAHGSSHGHFDFPFAPATAEQPLNALTLHAGLHDAVEQLLSSPKGGTRLVHAGMVGTTSNQPRTVLNSEGYVDSAAAEFSDIYAHEAFTMLPSAGVGDAAVVYLPLEADCGAVVLQFDPQHEHDEVAITVQQLLASHMMLLRIIVRRAEADYISCDSYTSASGLSPELLAPLSVWQRARLHIPLPGHEYWTADTVAAAYARYGWDPSPYCDRLAPKDRTDALQQMASSKGLMSAHCTRDGGGWTRNESGLLPGTDAHTTRWEQPQQALPDSADGAVLSAQQVAEFHEYGYLAMDGIWPAEVIQDGKQALEGIYPAIEEWNLEKQEHPLITQSHDPHVNQFPYSQPALNAIVLHRRILTAVTQLLGGEIRFYGDVSLAKYGTDPPAGDQELHLDFEGNMSLVPPEKANAVKCILNYSHVEESAGPTRFVPGPEGLVTPRQLAAGELMNPEEVYPYERTICYSPGSVLIYVNRLWHRGSPVNNCAVRYTQHFNYVRSDALWVGSHTWARALWSLEKRKLLPNFTRAGFLSTLTALQRRALGCPENSRL